MVEFPDGESYICHHFTDYESENSGELDIEMDDPRYDEFYQIAMDVIETIQAGRRSYSQGFTLDYRDWSALIKDVDRDTVVYSAAGLGSPAASGGADTVKPLWPGIDPISGGGF